MKHVMCAVVFAATTVALAGSAHASVAGTDTTGAAAAEGARRTCDNPVVVLGVSAGIDADGDNAKACAGTTDNHIEAGHTTNVYPSGSGGTVTNDTRVCEYDGSLYTCFDAGFVGGASVSDDHLAVSVVPEVCRQESSWDGRDCWLAVVGAGVDGPSGDSAGAGAGVFVCQTPTFMCPVKFWQWINLLFASADGTSAVPSASPR